MFSHLVCDMHRNASCLGSWSSVVISRMRNRILFRNLAHCSFSRKRTLIRNIMIIFIDFSWLFICNDKYVDALLVPCCCCCCYYCCWNSTTAVAYCYYCTTTLLLVMAAVRSRCGHYIFALWFPVLSFCLFFLSSPNLSRSRLDVYRTSTHGVALVRI